MKRPITGVTVVGVVLAALWVGQTPGRTDTAWAGPSLLGSSALGAPAVAASADGSPVAVAWQESTDIEVRVSRDAGASWSSPKTLVNNAYVPKIAMSSDGQNVVVAWIKDNQINEVVQSSVSTNFGASWAGAISLSGPASVDAFDLHASSDLTRITMAWAGNLIEGGETLARSVSTSDRGQTWSNEVVASGGHGGVRNLQLSGSAD